MRPKTKSAVPLVEPLRAACLGLLLAAVFGCAGLNERGADREEIVVAAAANLSEAFAEVGRRFEARTGVRVVNSFGATADLARQIESGAPFDVFAAADTRHVEELERKGFIAPGTRRVYARGRLVLWSPPPADGPIIERLEDLAGPRVARVAIPKPDLAPYGEAAVEALRASGLWARVEPKVVYAQNVAQARQFAATGNADAAFLPRSLVRPGEGRLLEIDEALHRPLEQALGVVESSARRAQARAFAEFVAGDEVRAILKSYGYN
jgi:molybdate transport system substrate-binding protein